MSTPITLETAVVTATLVSSGLRYVHSFVTNIAINDPKENALSASPQGYGDGVAYGTNLTAPVTLAMTVRDMPRDLYDMYKKAHKQKDRITFMVTNIKATERYDFNKSIVKSNPSNRTIDDGETALDVMLNIDCVQGNFNHNPAED
jgi:hypothetical protein